MGIIEIILVCVGVSLDLFAVAVCNGAILEKIDSKKLFAVCGVACLWQTAAVALGSLLSLLPLFSQKPDGYADRLCDACSVIILAAIGLFLLYKGFRSSDFLERRGELNLKAFNQSCLLVSVDAFFAGLSFALCQTPMLSAIITIFVVTLLAAVLGLLLGYRLGYEPQKNARLIGGAALFVAAAIIVLRLLLIGE